MAQKELVFKLKYLSEGGEIVEKQATTFKEIQKSVSDLQDELNNTDLGSEQFKKLQGDLKNSQGALQQASRSTQSLGQQFTAIPGPIGMAAQSVMGLGTALKALIANPIGAVIAAIGAVFIGLYKAINSTEEGTFKFKEAFAALSGILDPVLKLLGQIGVVLIDGILAGIDAVQDALAFLGFDSFAKASDDAENLARSINEVEDAEGELAVARAKQNKQLAEAREIISDTNVSLAERKKALQDVKKSEEDLAKKEVELSQKRLANVREELRLKGKSKELLDAEEQALISLFNTQQSQAAVNRKNIKAEQALDREVEAERKKIAADAKQREKDRLVAIENRKKAELAASDLEKQLNLELIKDQQERALKELEINKEKQIRGITELQISEQRKQDLILKVEASTQIKREKIESDGYTKSLEAFNAYRQFLIQQELVNSDAVIQVAENTTNGVLTKYEDLFFKQRSSREEFIKGQENLDAEEVENLSYTLLAYDRYYETLRFQATQSYQADIADTARRKEEKQKQLDDATTFADLQLKINEQNYDKDLINEEEFYKQREFISKTYKERQIEINTFFDNFEKNRLKQFNAEILKIDNTQVQRRSQIEQKFAEFKKRVQDELRKAEDARVQLAIDAFEVTADLVGRETELGKKLAQASVLIQTWENASAAARSQLAIKTPDAPIRAAIAAGIQVAQGLFRVSQIQKIEVPKAAMGGIIQGQGSGTMDNIPVMVSNGESVINQQSTQAFGPLLSLINQLGGGASFDERGVTSSQIRTPQSQLASVMGGDTPPIKAYVVSQEISSRQEMDRRIQQRSTL